jgi:hypothetical protein
MKVPISILCVLLMATLLVGCVQRIGDFTIISTKNVELGAKYKMLTRAEGKDMSFMLIIPFGVPNLKNAVDNCIESAKGELLTNAVIEFTSTVLVGPYGYNVKGDVWTKASMSDLGSPRAELYELQSSEKGLTLTSVNDNSKKIQVYSHLQ